MLDGRDVPARSAKTYINTLNKTLHAHQEKGIDIRIASGGGRMITSMDHFTIVTDQLELTRRFYTDLLGLRVGQRPDFPVPGIWLYLKDEPVLHVIEVKEMPVPRRGVLDHMAFSANDLIRTLGAL